MAHVPTACSFQSGGTETRSFAGVYIMGCQSTLIAIQRLRDCPSVALTRVQRVRGGQVWSIGLGGVIGGRLGTFLSCAIQLAAQKRHSLL
jgi:hypothetical protein